MRSRRPSHLCGDMARRADAFFNSKGHGPFLIIDMFNYRHGPFLFDLSKKFANKLDSAEQIKRREANSFYQIYLINQIIFNKFYLISLYKLKKRSFKS